MTGGSKTHFWGFKLQGFQFYIYREWCRGQEENFENILSKWVPLIYMPKGSFFKCLQKASKNFLKFLFSLLFIFLPWIMIEISEFQARFVRFVGHNFLGLYLLILLLWPSSRLVTDWLWKAADWMTSVGSWTGRIWIWY